MAFVEFWYYVGRTRAKYIVRASNAFSYTSGVTSVPIVMQNSCLRDNGVLNLCLRRLSMGKVVFVVLVHFATWRRDKITRFIMLVISMW